MIPSDYPASILYSQHLTDQDIQLIANRAVSIDSDNPPSPVRLACIVATPGLLVFQALLHTLANFTLSVRASFQHASLTYHVITISNSLSRALDPILPAPLTKWLSRYTVIKPPTTSSTYTFRRTLLPPLTTCIPAVSLALAQPYFSFLRSPILPNDSPHDPLLPLLLTLGFNPGTSIPKSVITHCNLLPHLIYRTHCSLSLQIQHLLRPP